MFYGLPWSNDNVIALCVSALLERRNAISKSRAMATPTLDKFLGEVARILREKNGPQLQDFLVLEPPLPPLYQSIVNEVRQSFPAKASQNALEAKCEKVLLADEDEDGGSWSSFITFLVKYFSFLRDVDVNNLVETHDMLQALLKSVFRV